MYYIILSHIRVHTVHTYVVGFICMFVTFQQPFSLLGQPSIEPPYVHSVARKLSRYLPTVCGMKHVRKEGIQWSKHCYYILKNNAHTKSLKRNSSKIINNTNIIRVHYVPWPHDISSQPTRQASITHKIKYRQKKI